MYLLITVLVALLVGLVLMVLVQVSFGTPEEVQDAEVERYLCSSPDHSVYPEHPDRTEQ